MFENDYERPSLYLKPTETINIDSGIQKKPAFDKVKTILNPRQRGRAGKPES